MATVGQLVVWNNTGETEVTEATATGIATTLAGVYAPMPIARIDAQRNLADDTTNQAVFPPGANALTVVAGMTYRFRCGYYLLKGSNAVNFRPLLQGTATFTTISFSAHAFFVLAPNITTTQSRSRHTTAGVANVVAGAAPVNQSIELDGIFEINAGGTIIPSVNLSAASGATPAVLVDTYFECWPIGANPVTAIGPWS